jgi:hypothetical protein
MAGIVSHGSVERESVVPWVSPLQEIGGVAIAGCRSKPRDGEPCRKRLAQGLAQLETPGEGFSGTGREQSVDVGGDRNKGRVLAHPWRKRSGIVPRRWQPLVVLTEQA